MPTVNLQANLNEAPINQARSPIGVLLNDQALTFGDMHGNAIKLIYLLVQNGVMELDKKDYDRLKEIYDTANASLTPADLDEFEGLLKNATYNKCGMVRLIGDELADRGNNDYFTLCIMRTLQEKQIPFEITLSNHSVIALREFDPGVKPMYMLGPRQQASLQNMWQMLNRRGFENKHKEALRIANEVYKPHLLLIGYNIQTDGTGSPVLNLYTHAPVGLETVKALADKFVVSYDDSSIEALITSIDAINAKATAAIAQGTFSRDYFDGHKYQELQKGPLEKLFWARELQTSFTLTPAGSFKVVATHGHVGPVQVAQIVQHEGLTNLDNYLGKELKTDTKGEYPVQFEIHQPKPFMQEHHSTPAQQVQNLSTPKQEQSLEPDNDAKEAKTFKEFKEANKKLTAPEASPDTYQSPRSNN